MTASRLIIDLLMILCVLFVLLIVSGLVWQLAYSLMLTLLHPIESYKLWREGRRVQGRPLRSDR